MQKYNFLSVSLFFLGAQFAACELPQDEASATEDEVFEESSGIGTDNDSGETEGFTDQEGIVIGDISSGDLNEPGPIEQENTRILNNRPGPQALMFGDTKQVTAIVASVYAKWKFFSKPETKKVTIPYSAPAGWIILDYDVSVAKKGDSSYHVSVFGPGKFSTSQALHEVYSLAISLALQKGDNKLAADLDAEYQEKLDYAYELSSSAHTLSAYIEATAYGSIYNHFDAQVDLKVTAELMYVGNWLPPNKDDLKLLIQEEYGLKLIDTDPPPEEEPVPVCGDGIKELCKGEECEPGEMLLYGWSCTEDCTLYCWKGNCSPLSVPDICL